MSFYLLQDREFIELEPYSNNGQPKRTGSPSPMASPAHSTHSTAGLLSCCCTQRYQVSVRLTCYCAPFYSSSAPVCYACPETEACPLSQLLLSHIDPLSLCRPPFSVRMTLKYILYILTLLLLLFDLNRIATTCQLTITHQPTNQPPTLAGRGQSLRMGTFVWPVAWRADANPMPKIASIRTGGRGQQLFYCSYMLIELIPAHLFTTTTTKREIILSDLFRFIGAWLSICIYLYLYTFCEFELTLRSVFIPLVWFEPVAIMAIGCERDKNTISLFVGHVLNSLISRLPNWT